jgi:hypothetical protein
MPKLNATGQDWILLVHLLPPQPTNLRVRIWRKLQALGAIAIKNSVYALPFSDKTHEDCQWLKQEIEASGGEATVFRAGAVEGTTDQELIALFRKARDEDYARVAAELEGLTGALREQQRGGHLSPGRLAHYEAELEKLHAELERIAANDFFHARGRAAAAAAYERGQQALRVAQPRPARAGASESGALDLAQYQGRRWVTRRHMHIDRLACVWLIKRFIDRRARFFFVDEGAEIKGGIRFDMFGAELTHEGEDCTFETMLKRCGLRDDAALRGIAEIVHDIDLKDRKFNRLEAAGINAVVTGLAALLKDDRKLARQGGAIFDGLYALLRQDAAQPARQPKSPPSKPARRRQAPRAAKQPKRAKGK